jgi:energy-coupling factor transporter ATP-binding protein EcfA2
MSTIVKIEFTRLKGLRDLAIEFPEKGVVALMGENGIGKSTVLHALACIYRPHEHIQVKNGDNGSWWTDWFVPHTGNYWDGSSVRVFFTGSPDGTVYSKNERWQPRSGKRRERFNRFIGLKDCMPHIEDESQKSRFEFATVELDLSPAKRTALVQAASGILNRQYIAIQRGTKRSGLKRFLLATVSQGQPPVKSSYTSHYMGAGEYKVLRLIQEVLAAPNGGLLLIEELEVSIHEAALRRLMLWLIQQSDEKDLQIVFSTHWSNVVEFSENIAIRTLHSTRTKVVCINGFRPMALHRMSGNDADIRIINIWVEDPLAKRIVQQVCTELNILRNVDILTFGAIDNAFSVAAVLELEARDINRNVVVTDGDRYATADDKKTQIKRALSGTGEALEQAQKNTERWFAQFEPLMPDGHRVNPERFLIEAARRTAAAGAATPWVTSFLAFVDANIFPDPHKSIVLNLHKAFNLSVERIEWFLIEAATKDAAWHPFTDSVRQRLKESAERLGLDLKEAA